MSHSFAIQNSRYILINHQKQIQQSCEFEIKY